MIAVGSYFGHSGACSGVKSMVDHGKCDDSCKIAGQLPLVRFASGASRGIHDNDENFGVGIATTLGSSI